MRPVRILLLLLMQFTLSPVALAQETTTADPAETIITDEYLGAWTKYSEGLRNNLEQTGLGFGVLAAPFNVQLIIAHSELSNPILCSGILISSQSILTAAHCFCDLESTIPSDQFASYCQNKADASRTEIFLPLAGVLYTQGHPSINPRYVPGTLANKKAQDYADLALVDLAAPVLGFKTAALFDGELSDQNMASSGFGHFTFASTSQNLPVMAKVPYRPGIQQMTAHSRVDDDPSCSPNFNQTDAVCIRYDAGPNFGARQDRGSVCSGDSGGPLMQRNLEGDQRVVGIASYFWPPGQDCSAELTSIGVYTDVRNHKQWINEHLNLPLISSGNPIFRPAECFEAVLGNPGSYMTESEFRYSSVRTSSALFQSEIKTSSAKLGDTGNCEARLDIGADICRTDVPAKLLLSVPEDSVVQFVVCK